MKHLVRSLAARLPHHAFRRVLAIAVLAVQATVVSAPIWEREVAARPTTHVDEAGKQHVSLHGDANCGLCAVRASTPMPPSVGVALTEGGADHAIASSAATLGARGVVSSLRSRAPPQAD